MPWYSRYERTWNLPLFVPPELLVEGLGRPVAHHGHLAGDAQARRRRVARVEAAAVPLGVRVDGLALRLRGADLPRRVVGAARDGRDGLHVAAAAERPLQRLHATQGATDHRGDAVGPDAVLHHVQVRVHRVSHAHLREVDEVLLARRRVDAQRPGAPVAGAEDVGADDEVLVRVKGLAWAEQASPPARHVAVAREGVAYHQHVVLGLVQGAVAVVADLHALQPHPVLELESVDDVGLSVGRHLAVLVLHAVVPQHLRLRREAAGGAAAQGAPLEKLGAAAGAQRRGATRPCHLA